MDLRPRGEARSLGEKLGGLTTLIGAAVEAGCRQSAGDARVDGHDRHIGPGLHGDLVRRAVEGDHVSGLGVDDDRWVKQPTVDAHVLVLHAHRRLGEGGTLPHPAVHVGQGAEEGEGEGRGRAQAPRREAPGLHAIEAPLPGPEDSGRS